MKSGNLFLLCVMCFFFIFSKEITKVQDDSDRISVKTLTDKEAAKINWFPERSSVKALSKLVQPYPNDKKFNKKVRFAYECNTYSFTCKIKGFIPNQNGGYDLLLVEPSDTTCVIKAEILNPELPQLVDSKYKKSFSTTITDFKSYITGTNQVKEGTYSIAGVAFFENNKMSICPIMDIKKNFR